MIVNIKYPIGRAAFGVVNSFCTEKRRRGTSDEYDAEVVSLNVILNSALHYCKLIVD